jgi:hypothetical protein
MARFLKKKIEKIHWHFKVKLEFMQALESFICSTKAFDL